MVGPERNADACLTPLVAEPTKDLPHTSMELKTFDAICACRNGYIKSVSFADPVQTQSNRLIRCDWPATLVRLHPVDRNQLFVASTDNSSDKETVSTHIQLFNMSKKSQIELKCDVVRGRTVGIAVGDGNRVFACQSATDSSVYEWNLGEVDDVNIPTIDPKLIFNAGPNVESMEQYRNVGSDRLSHFIATGGEENDVAVYDLTRTDAGPIFRAKNVPPNWVQLREPVWVRKLHIMDSECHKILCGTNHHQIRVYDRRIAAGVEADKVSTGTDSLCRPVISFDWHDVPVTALSVNYANDQQIFAGNALGKLEMLDLRMKRVVYAYKGVGGTVKALECHLKQEVLLVGSLDRFIRLYDVKSRKLLKEVYVTSEVNDALLVTTENINWGVEADGKQRSTASDETSDDDRRGRKRQTAAPEGDDGLDEIWNRSENEGSSRKQRT